MVSISYSTFQGVWDGPGGAGNIHSDPLFIRRPNGGGDGWDLDDDFGDLRLRSGSPCIDAGDTSALPPDAFDLDADGDTAEPFPMDLGRKPRTRDDPFVPDTGAGTPPVTDMGSYEFVPGTNVSEFEQASIE
jgi:hypothetical protein